MLKKVQDFLANEERSYAWLMRLHEQSELMLEREHEQTKFDSLTKEALLREAMQAVDRCTAILHRWGFRTNVMDAGHGMGHIVRDYTMALVLAPSMECTNATRFAAVLAGTFHDIGCALQGRYEDSERVMRHAGAGAYLMQQVFAEAGIDRVVSELAVLGIAAHTHYLVESSVLCKDGVTRRVLPFVDTHKDGSPAMAIWGARWVDRCDTSGPTFVGRHILTLTNVKKDYASDGFYNVDPAEHFNPVLRSGDEIKAAGGRRTMLEHLDMFRLSQSNASPYGKFDNAFMQEIRDARAASLKHITDAVVAEEVIASPEAILNRFESFLGTNIEPDQNLGRPAAKKVLAIFRTLSGSVQERWVAGFEATMAQYHVYHEQVMDLLADSSITQGPTDELQILGRNVFSVLSPHRSWSTR